MNVLQTLPASCSQVDQENVKLKIKNINMIFFSLVINNFTSRNVSSEVFPWTIGKSFRPSKSAETQNNS